MPVDLRKVSVTVGSDEALTIRGVSVERFRSILTAASLYCHEHPAPIEPLTGFSDSMTHCNNIGMAESHLNRATLIGVLNLSMSGELTKEKLDFAVNIYEYRQSELENSVQKIEKSLSKTADPDPAAELGLAIEAMNAAMARVNAAQKAALNSLKK